MNREKYPALSKRFDDLVARRDAVLAQLAPLELEAAKLQAVMDAATAKWRAKREQMVAIEERGKLRQISQEIAALARAMGAHSLKAEG